MVINSNDRAKHKLTSGTVQISEHKKKRKGIQCLRHSSFRYEVFQRQDTSNLTAH